MRGFGLKFTEEKMKNPDGGLQKWKITIASHISCDLIVTADHEHAQLVAGGKHFLRLGADELRIPAGDVSETLPEEFARMLIGQPKALRRYRVAAHLRR